MGFVGYFICSLGSWSTTGNEVEKVLLLGIGMIVGLGVYLVSCYCEE